jgi:hypothetical protein
MVSLIQTTIGTILGPLVAELAASRQANERSQDRVAALERENGRLSAELDALRAAQTPVPAQETASPVETPMEPSAPDAPVSAPWWRRWLGAVSG